MAGKLQLASSGGDIKIWGTPDLTLVKAFIPHSQPVGSLCWSPNNQCLASAASDKVVVTYVKGDVYSPVEIPAGEGNTCVAFNSSSRYLLTGGKSKTLGIWDMKTKSLKKTYRDHKDVVSCSAFNWNDTVIASGSVNGDILLHNALTGQASDPLRLQKTQAVRDIQFSYFKKSLLGAVSDDGALNLWDSNARKLMTSFNADHKAPATGLSFSPMNDMLVCSVGLDKRIVFYDVQGKKSVKVMTAESPLTAVDFMADGATLAVGSTRGKIFVYDLRSGSAPVGTTAAHKTSVQALSFQSSVKVSSAGSNRSGKPAILNAKPSSGQPPVQLSVTTAPNPSSIPTTKPPEPTADVYSNIKENGLKEDDEDIFSPLREIKTPVINSRLAATLTLPGSEEQTSTSFKENNPPDVSGIFSPLGSNPSVINDVQLGGSTLQTLGETTVNAPTTSQNPRSTSNVELSSTRSISNLHPAQDLRSASGLNSYPESHLINEQKPADTRPPSDSLHGRSLVPSRARPQYALVVDSRPPLDERARTTNDVSGVYSAENSHRSRNGLDTVIQGRNEQPFHKSDPDAVRTGNKDGKDEVRRPADGAGTMEQDPGQCGTCDTMVADAQISRPSSRASSDSNMLGDAKLSPEPLSSGAVAMLLPGINGEASGNPGFLPFQVQFIKNLIDESLDEFRVALHRDIVNVQVEMLRQFQIQQNDLKAMLEKYSVNEALVTEIERLKEENNRLKSKY